MGDRVSVQYGPLARLRARPTLPLTPEPRGNSLVANRYRIIERRWRGMASTRLLALDTQEGSEPVEVVILPGRAHCDEHLRAMTSWARADIHPILNRIRSVFLGRRFSVLVSDVAGGESLSTSVFQGHPLPFAKVAFIGQQLLVALKAAHEYGIIGNDVSPGSIRWDDPSSVHWTGAGMGWLLFREATCRGARSALWGLLPPTKPITIADDLYMLAVSLCALAQGSPLHTPPPGQLGWAPTVPGMPPHLAETIRNAIAGRYENADEMLEDLLPQDLALSNKLYEAV